MAELDRLAQTLRATLFAAPPRLFWFGLGQTREERAAMMAEIPPGAQRAALHIMRTVILADVWAGAEDRPLIHYMATDAELAGEPDHVAELRAWSMDWRLILTEGPAGFLCDFNGWPGDNESGAGVFCDSRTGELSPIFENVDGGLTPARESLQGIVASYELTRNLIVADSDGDDEAGDEAGDEDGRDNAYAGGGGEESDEDAGSDTGGFAALARPGASPAPGHP